MVVPGLLTVRGMRRTLLLAALALVACNPHRNDPPAPATAPSTVASVASARPSASVAVAVAPSLPAPPANPKRPAWLKRVAPKKVTTSSFLKDKGGSWVGALATDRSRKTAWQPAAEDSTPWIEVTFDKPVQLWGVRSDAGWINSAQYDKSGKPKSIQLRLDAKDAYQLAVDGPAADFLGIDAKVTTVRLSYSDPASISELSFWTDASDAPSVPRKIVEDELATLDGDAAKAKAVLLRFGVVPKGEVENATAKLHALTDDVHVLEVTMGRKEGTWAGWVFLGEVEKDGMKRLFGLDAEVLDEPGTDDPKLELGHVHDDHDVTLTWSVLRDGTPTRHGLRVLSVARGGVERIADLLDERLPHVDHEKDEIVLEPTGSKPRWRLRYDERAHLYW